MHSKYLRLNLIYFYVLICFLPIPSQAIPGFHPPWGKDADLSIPSQEREVSNPKHSLAVRVAEKIILFHQQVLSPVDGPRSHFRPSSSAYMKDALFKYGFFQGFALGCDRLIRENSDEWVYRKIEENGKLFKYNPVP